MTKINKCDIVRDLIPLYIDHVVSEASEELVVNHVETCPECKKFLEETSSTLVLPVSIEDRMGEQKGFKKIKKAINKKVWKSVVISAVCVFLLLSLLNNNKVYIKNFDIFSIDNLPYANEIIEDSLKREMRDIGYTKTSDDDLDNRIMIGSFGLHFRNNSFSNLQYAIILSESGEPFEKNFQVNHEGQIFTSPKTLTSPTMLSDNMLFLIDLKNVIRIVSESDVIQKISVSEPKSVELMFNGYMNVLPEGYDDFTDIYIIQDEKIVPLSLYATDSYDGYFVFSIVSETVYIHILYPKYS